MVHTGDVAYWTWYQFGISAGLLIEFRHFIIADLGLDYLHASVEISVAFRDDQLLLFLAVRVLQGFLST